MPTQETISRIAKILARAGSDNQNEATAALEGAYKRMVRDGVTIQDLLSLPISELYQDTLVKLIGVILADQPNMSHPTKRAAYAEYIQIISAKFSGSSDRNQSNGSANPGKNREDEAREYEERRAREERARGRAEQGRASSQEREPPFRGENVDTQSQDRRYTWSIRNRIFSFSPRAFFAVMQTVLGRGSILWHTLHDPVAGLRLFAASFLWGVAFAAVILVLAGVGHSITDTRPLWDITLKNAFSFLVAVGMIWKARAFFHAGWFR